MLLKKRARQRKRKNECLEVMFMAIYKSKALRDMSRDELEKKLSELRMELMKERAKIKVGGVPDNPGRIKEIRRTISRILTIKKEKAEDSKKVKKE